MSAETQTWSNHALAQQNGKSNKQTNKKLPEAYSLRKGCQEFTKQRLEANSIMHIYNGENFVQSECLVYQMESCTEAKREWSFSVRLGRTIYSKTDFRFFPKSGSS